MKRVLCSIALAVCFIGFSSFETETTNPDVIQSFLKKFKNAQNISWTQVDDMMRIGFTSNGQNRFAYYVEGQLVVVATEISKEALPASLQTQLGQYNDFTVTQIYELEKNGKKNYCVVLDNSTRHVVLSGKTRFRAQIENKR